MKYKLLSPLKAIHKYCVWCVGGQSRKLDVLCAGEECGCPLYPYRHGRDELTSKDIRIVVLGEGIKVENYSPLKAIRYKCLDCSGGSKSEVRSCICYENNPEKVDHCPLWDFREGHNPHRKGVGNKKAKPPMRGSKTSELTDNKAKNSPSHEQGKALFKKS